MLVAYRPDDENCTSLLNPSFDEKMNKRITILVVGLVVLVGIGIGIVAPVLLSPSFVVINRSQHVVNISASWRNKNKEIGLIQPSSSFKFSVSDEAAIKFKGVYPDGRVVSSEEIYFTTGLGVIAIISEQNIDVKYEHET